MMFFMKTDPLSRRWLRFLAVFLSGAVFIACSSLFGPDDPDDPGDPGDPGNPGNPGSVSEEVVVHNFSADTSRVEILSLEPNEEGNMVMSVRAPANQLPKPGEYLVSAPTELAPYGYLLRVMKVTEETRTRGIGDTVEEISAKIESVFATINEIVQNINFQKVFYIPLPDVSFEQFKPILEGVKCTFETSTDATGLENLPFDADGKLQNPSNFAFNADGDMEFIPGEVAPDNGEGKKKGNKAKVSFDGFEIDGIKIKPEFSFTQKGLFFYFEILEGTFQKFGVDYEANLSFSLEIQDTFKGKLVDKKIPFGALVQNYIVPVGEVPVVVTLVVPIILELKLEGSIGFGIKPLDVDLDIGVGSYYDFPRKSFFPYFGHDEYVDVTDKTSQKEYSGLGSLVDSELTLKGSFSADLSSGVSIGFFGCNIIDRKAGWMIDGKNTLGKERSSAEKKLLKEFKDVMEAEFMIDGKADVSAKVQIGSIDEVAADLYIRDDCGLKIDWGGKLAASFKIPFVSSIIPPWVSEVVEKYTPWNEKVQVGIIQPSWETPRGTLFDSSKKKTWPHTLFFPGYSDLKVEDGPDGKNVMVVSVIKTKPLLERFGLRPFTERNFGFCFVPSDLKNEAAGPFSEHWITYDLSNRPEFSYPESTSWVDINTTVPKTGIQRNRSYDLFAYSVIEGPLLEDIYLFRANKQFKLSETGKVSTIDLDDVPGENL